jgi:hypothetical protein
MIDLGAEYQINTLFIAGRDRSYALNNANLRIWLGADDDHFEDSGGNAEFLLLDIASM